MSTIADHRGRFARAILLTAIGLTPALAGATAASAHSATHRGAARDAVAAAASIADRTRARQRGPIVVIAVRLRTAHPSGAGVLVLRSVPGRRILSRAFPGERGIASFIATLADAVAGPHVFSVTFAPYDRKRYRAASRVVRVVVGTPIEYPFARTSADRSVSRADRLPPYAADGAPCSVGCRPVGAVDGWPLMPFHDQHPLRAGIDEHRPSGFHVGVDIQAKDWSPVFAIQPGHAHIISSTWPDARVRVGNYIYWHVKPAVREGERVVPYVTVLGHVLRSMGHLHLSEVDANGHWLNPLRPGGRVLAPYADDEPPVVGAPHVLHDGRVIVEAFDPQSFRVRTRYLTPVLAPAGLAYRLWRADGTPDGPLQWALRATHVLGDSLVNQVFTTRAREPGYFCFATRPLCKPRWEYWLAGGLAPRIDLVSHRGERLTIYAWDWDGNVTARDTRL